MGDRRKLLVFLLVWVALLAGAALLDRTISQAVQSHKLLAPRQPLVVWWMGRYWFVLPVAALLSLLHPWRWRAGALVALAPLPAALAEWLLKWAVGRTRPGKGIRAFDLQFFRDGLHGLFDEKNLSYPSGHACAAFAMATALGICLPRWRAAWFAVAALVALQRVLEGAHYSSDVVGGAGIGIISAYVVLRIARAIFPSAATEPKVQGT